jgi:hypothetical protein
VVLLCYERAAHVPRQLAEYHFRRALAINGRSSVLRCYLGLVLHAQVHTARRDRNRNEVPRRGADHPVRAVAPRASR